MFHHFLNNATNYLHHHPQMGILFAFLVAFLESLPIVGTIVPGSITMTIVGVMIGAGLIPGYLTIAVASLGAFSGDLIGFGSGRIFKDRIRTVWPFSRHPKIINISETFIKKHGGKSILIGRFMGVARSAVPLVAGVLHLSWVRFILAALPTAILWAFVYCLPGILLGAFSLEIPPKLLTEYIVFGVIVIVVLWGIYWLIQRFFTNITAFYDRQIDRYWAFLQRHRGSNFIIKYIHNRQNPDSHHQLSRLLLASLCLIIFIIILLNALFQSNMMLVDQPMFSFAQSLRIYHLNPFFITLSLFGKTTIVMLIAFVMSFILVCCRQWRAATHLCFATIATAVVVYLIKYADFNARPSGFMIVASSSSFPSGHVAMSLVVFGLLGFFTGRLFENSRGIINLIVVVLVGLIAASRLYLGAHWLVDVIASIFLGLTILLITTVNYQRLPRPSSKITLNHWIWLTIMLIVTFGIWAGNVYFQYHSATYRYTPFVKRISTQQHQWWETPLEFTPAYRDNRFGRPAQPLNIQWAGHLDKIKSTLQQHGWKLISRKNHVADTIHRLASDKPQYHLPLFELLYHNKRPSLIMYKSIPKKSMIYILRLWDSHVDFHDGNIIWIGMINKLAAPHSFITFHHRNLMSFAKLSMDNDLFGNDKSFVSKVYKVPMKQIPERVKSYHWDGKIWLIKSKY
jgi:membrane protein DedA with SNARE-associated domain/membrane-associated phospholipid phosphatase